MPAYNSVVFIKAEAQFVQTTMFAYSQNRAVGSETDAGSVSPITAEELALANSILDKVRKQMLDPATTPISFTEAEAKLQQYLYRKYLEVHGKPQGDLDWTYWVNLDTNTQALVQDVIRKVGGISNLYPSNKYPAGGFNPFPRL